ncbi:thioredoxin family protein [Ferrimonas pelagia]|uniref:Thioredoxin n=1 Tax=Ferrimonas pelagia TaxID=1177826 RepID=A0ABP9FDT6_9GAMM
MNTLRTVSLAAMLVPALVVAQPEAPIDHKKMLSIMSGTQDMSAPQAQGNPHAAMGGMQGNPHGGEVMQEAILTGELDANRMIFELVPMGRSYLDYQVDTQALAPLQGYSKATEITVILGTWCGTCHVYTPAFIKIMKALDNANIQVRYIGVDKQRQAGDVSLDGIEFNTIPTYIIAQEGKEIGRIAGEPETSLERDLVRILTQ